MTRAHGSVARGAKEELDPAQLRAARLLYLDDLSRRVDAETADPAWSLATEATIRRVVPAQLGPTVSVAEAKCGSSICRAKLNHASSARIPDDRFVTFTLHRESLGTLELQLDTRAEGSTTLYFLRAR